MKREIRQISTLPPLQRDTAQIVPKSYILGGAYEATDVVGTKISGAITVERVADNMPVLDTSLRFVCTETGKFTVTNQETGYVTEEKNATSADVVITEFAGLNITVDKTKFALASADDICDVAIIGDSTYIVPGTILGRINVNGNTNNGKYEPIGSVLTKYDVLRVCGGTIETDKANFVAPVSNTMNTDDRYTVDVYVFGQVIESVCRAINMTDGAKAKLQGIVWE